MAWFFSPNHIFSQRNVVFYFLIEIIKLGHRSENVSIKVSHCVQRHWMGPIKITVILYGFIFLFSFMIMVYVIFRRGAYIEFIFTTYSSYGIITLSVCAHVCRYFLCIWISPCMLSYAIYRFYICFIVLLYYLVSNDQIKMFSQSYFSQQAGQQYYFILNQARS